MGFHPWFVWIPSIWTDPLLILFHSSVYWWMTLAWCRWQELCFYGADFHAEVSSCFLQPFSVDAVLWYRQQTDQGLCPRKNIYAHPDDFFSSSSSMRVLGVMSYMTSKQWKCIPSLSDGSEQVNRLVRQPSPALELGYEHSTLRSVLLWCRLHLSFTCNQIRNSFRQSRQ